jgi:hypothetical protein
MVTSADGTVRRNYSVAMFDEADNAFLADLQEMEVIIDTPPDANGTATTFELLPETFSPFLTDYVLVSNA